MVNRTHIKYLASTVTETKLQKQQQIVSFMHS